MLTLLNNFLFLYSVTLYITPGNRIRIQIICNRENITLFNQVKRQLQILDAEDHSLTTHTLEDVLSNVYYKESFTSVYGNCQEINLNTGKPSSKNFSVDLSFYLRWATSVSKLFYLSPCMNVR